MFLMQNHRPAGKVQTRMWRSKKKDTHVVGWCSDTDAMMGMWILAYLWKEGDERGREGKWEGGGGRDRRDVIHVELGALGV